MINVEYANAYAEVLEILKYVSKEEYDKIPHSKIELFETNKNENYVFKYYPNKTLEEQKVSKRAKAIISILFRDYWASDLQREKILKKQNSDRKLFEENKKTLFDVENIFKNKNNETTNINNETKEMVIYKKEKWYTTILMKIRKLFAKK